MSTQPYITYCAPFIDPEKRQYNKVTDSFAALASTGSANPGCQFISLDDAPSPETDEILSAWQHRVRWRIHRHPVDPSPDDVPSTTFIDDDISLETKSMCFGTAVRESEPVNCRYMGTPFVLTGQTLEAALRERGGYHTPKERERALAASEDEYELQEELDEPEDRMSFEPVESVACESENAKKIQPIVTKTVWVSDAEFDAHYARWFEDPSAHNQSLLFETLSYFVEQKLRTVSKNDTLRKRGLGDDVAHDFILAMIERMIEQQANGERLNEPSRYLTKAWKFTKWQQNKRTRKQDRRNQQSGIGAFDEGAEENYDGDGFEAQAHAEWKLGPPVSETSAEYRERCTSLLSSLPVDLRVLAGMYLRGMKQREMAEKLGVSQPAISKQMRSIKQQLNLIQQAERALVN